MYSLFKVTPDLAVRKTDGAFSITFVTSDMSNVSLDTGDATGIKVGLSFNHTFSVTPPYLINVISDFSLITDIACTGQSLTACDVSRFENLEYLDISNNSIGFFEISQNSKLTELNISNNLLTGTDIGSIIIALDEFGLSNGILDYSNNAELPIGDEAALAYDNLVAKGWIITGARPQSKSLTLKIDTTNVFSNSSGSNSIILPIDIEGGTDNSMLVDWGDGSEDTYFGNSGFPEHTYFEAGVKEITITPSGAAFSASFEYLNNASRDTRKLIEISQWGYLWRFSSGNRGFHGCQNLDITATDNVILPSDCYRMFYECHSLTAIGYADTSNVTDMTSMFYRAYVFNQAIGYWDVSSVTSFSGMFQDAQVFNQNINSWDVSSATNMNSMFYLARNFNQPLDNWNVSNVTNMRNMFNSASDFNQPLNSWNTSKVETMDGMFSTATLFNQPLNNWDTSSVRNMYFLFNNAHSFNQPLNNWDTSSVVNMANMFREARVFDQNISSWNVESVTDMAFMFRGATLSTVNYDALLIGWEAQAVKDNVLFNGGKSRYTLGGAAEAARQRLITDHNWSITDGGGI